MRWHTDECMVHAAIHSNPLCLAQCEQKWRKFERYIDLAASDNWAVTDWELGQWAQAINVRELLGIEEEVNTDDGA